LVFEEQGVMGEGGCNVCMETFRGLWYLTYSGTVSMLRGEVRGVVVGSSYYRSCGFG
jgi:hypothetical protein